MLAWLISWLESHMFTCFIREQFGMVCPGCGFQRSLILLLKGELWLSVLQYPALIPFLATLFFLAVHLIVKFRRGGTWLKYMFIFTAGLVMINFAVRLCLHPHA
jgi:hypothetical protein